MAEELDGLLREMAIRPGVRKRSELRETLRKAVGGDPDRCRSVVIGVAAHHRLCRERCAIFPGHPILQTTLLLSFECSLRDSGVVSALLTEVYHCEKTFERLFAGAVFGPGAAYLVTGRKSEFATAGENCAAVEYFLQHATKSRTDFDGCRLGEVIMKNADLRPLEAGLQVRNLQVISLLVKFGAAVDYRPAYPHRLLLLCKVRIRKVLHINWELPFGVERLPLPKALVSFVEAVDSELLHALLPSGCSFATE